MIQKKIVCSPSIKLLHEIEIKCIPAYIGSDKIIGVQIYRASDYSLLFTNDPNQLKKIGAKTEYNIANLGNLAAHVSSGTSIQFKDPLELHGDIFFRLICINKNKEFSRFSINTSFITDKDIPSYLQGNDLKRNKYEHKLKKEDIDPDKFKKKLSKTFEFELVLHFEDGCDLCRSKMDISELC